MDELNYEKLMKEKGLTQDQLTKDAQLGIAEIVKTLRGVKLQEGKGRGASQSVLDKIAMLDKQVTREITDNLKNTPPPAGKNDKSGEPAPNPKGMEVDAELKALVESGMSEITLDELKRKANKTYNIIFDNYSEDEQNGIETSVYSIMETSEKTKFAVKKL